MEADADLVQRALARDQQAFAALYDRYADRLYDYARRLTGNSADAADCVQDTFVLAIQRLHQLRDPSLVRPWLYAIARSEVHRRHRRVNRLQFTEPDEQAAMTAGGPTADDLLHQAELKALFAEAANGLDDNDREALDLHLRHGMTGMEIAAALGIPERQVSVVLQRVRERLGRSMGVVLLSRSPQCPELAGLQRTEGSPLTPLSRKRLARHIEGCATCSQQLSQRMRPEMLLSLLPLALAPALLRQTVLARMVAVAGTPGASGGQSGHNGRDGNNGHGNNGHGDNGRGGDNAPGNNGRGGNGAGQAASRRLRRREDRRVWQRSDGFPRPAMSRRLIGALSLAAMLLLVGTGVAVSTGGSSERRVTAANSTLPSAAKPGDTSNTGTGTGPGSASTGDALATASTTSTAPTTSAVLPTTPVVTAPPTVAPTSPPTAPPTAPPTTPPDTTPPVVVSASGNPVDISSLDTLNGVATCGDPYLTTSLVTVNATDDRGVVSVRLDYTIAAGAYSATFNKVGGTWQATLGPFPSAVIPTGAPNPANGTLTVSDAAGNTRVTNVIGVIRVVGCPIIT